MKIHGLSLAVAAVLVMVLMASCACATVYYVTPTGIDQRDGLSWGNSKGTIQAAITAASPGDEVWVKTGTYVENLTLDSGVALYGGFQGTETSRSQRPAFPRAIPGENETVIDGNAAGNVIMVAQNAVSSTRIDGFTVRNGYATFDQMGHSCGGGINIDGGSPVITNNTITDNVAWWYYYSGYALGGGIYCLNSQAVISNNVICYNEAFNGGGAIACEGGSPTIFNNTIYRNNDADISGYRGGGIACINECMAEIYNNTIAYNGGYGMLSDDLSAVVVTNNIIAFNYNGVVGSANTSLSHNCVYGNTNANYVGLSAGTGDISSDPLFASEKWDNFHIQANSPCRNTGDNSVVDASWRDMDGQVRIEGTAVDMGVDESDGTTWNVTPTVVMVSTYGNDSNTGLSWNDRLRTIQKGIDTVVKHGGGEVWVEAGTYEECISLGHRVYLYGGFAGDEASVTNRDWKRNVTTIDAQQAGTVVVCNMRNKLAGGIDGFTITNGNSNDNSTDFYRGGGINSHAGLIIKNNIITNNSSIQSSGGIRCDGAPVITNNVVSNNTCSSYGGGISCIGSAGGIIANNLIYNNTCTATQGYGGGIYILSYSSPMSIVNNTIVGNTATYGGAIDGGDVVANNIIAFNSSGTGGSTRINNCVYGNTNDNYCGPTDINVDPLFVDRNNNDFHLQATSPCINAGSNGSVGSGWLDMDLQARISDDGVGIVDIGADELYRKIATPAFSPDGGPYASAQTVTVTCATPGVNIHYTTNGAEPTTSDPVYTAPVQVTGLTILKAKAFLNTWVASDTKMAFYKIAGSYDIIRVDGVNGNDTNDGSTWGLAKKTITSAFGAVTAGDEVWIKGGTYNWKGGIPAGVGFYGGFAGNETERSQRDWVANPTILDGYGYLSITDTNGTSEIDGFTIKNGSYYLGAGVIISGNPLIIHNKFENNYAYYMGGAIYCSTGSPRIVSNIFTSNRTDNWGGAIFCGYQCSAIITNNTFFNNSANEGAVIYMASGASPSICNNLTYMNPRTFYGEAGAVPFVRNNYVYIFSYAPGYAYKGVTPGIDDIVTSSDNGNFSSYSDGNYCLGYNPQLWDNGWEDAPGVPATDIDGQARRCGRIDIGANELYVIRVSTTGSDTNSGTSWTQPKQTIQAALDVDKAPLEVWVKAGTYNEYINMTTGDIVFGGFNGTETDAHYWTRDWINNVCVIDSGGAASNVVITKTKSTREARISGFTIRNGASTDGGGISCSGSPVIDHNRIETNYVADFGGGICCWDGSPRIFNNLILGNESGGIGGGIFCGYNSSPVIMFNTITGLNTAYLDGGAIYITNTSSPTIKSNIIFQNPNSIFAEPAASPTLGYNLVWAGGGLGYSYSGLNPGTGDINNQDPYFMGPNDYSLNPASPCINTGIPDYYQYEPLYGDPIWVDYSTGYRSYGGNVEMGAYEYVP